MELTLTQRKAIAKAQLDKWPKASRVEKSAILDAICQVTGWHREHARKAILLRGDACRSVDQSRDSELHGRSGWTAQDHGDATA